MHVPGAKPAGNLKTTCVRLRPVTVTAPTCSAFTVKLWPLLSMRFTPTVEAASPGAKVRFSANTLTVVFGLGDVLSKFTGLTTWNGSR